MTSRHNRERILVYLPAVVLFLIPSIFWVNPFSHIVSASGDIPNILLLHPISFLEHFGIWISHDGATSSSSLAAYDPLAVVAAVALGMHLDPSAIVSGVTLMGCYCGVRLVVIELSSVSTASVVKRDCSRSVEYAAAFAGLMAALAPMIAQLFWSNFVPGIYLLAVVPCVSGLIIRYVRTGAVRYVALACVISAFGAPGLLDIPDALPTVPIIVIVVGIYVYLSQEVKVAIAVKRFLVMAVSGLLVNGIWIVSFVATIVEGNQQIGAALSKSGKTTGYDLVNVLSKSQNLLDTLSLNLSKTMMEQYGWPQLAIYNNNIFLIACLLIPMVLIVLALLVSSKATRCSGRDSNSQELAWVLRIMAFGTLVYCGFVSMKIPGSISLWKYLLVLVPGWTATRNFFVTFAIGYTLVASVTVGIAIVVLINAGFVKLIAPMMATSAIALCIAGLPFVNGSYFRLPYIEGGTSNRTLSSVPVNYEKIVRVLISMHPHRSVATLPLSTSDWSYLVGKDSSGRFVTYIGVSPLYILTGMSDYDGMGIFDSARHPNVGKKLGFDIATDRLREAAGILRSEGIGWIINESFSSIPETSTETIESAPNSPYAYVALSTVKVLGKAAIESFSSPDKTWSGHGPVDINEPKKASWWQPVGVTINPTIKFRVQDGARIAGVYLHWLTWSWWKPHYPVSFKIQSSSNGKVWDTRAVVRDNVSGDDEVRFSSVVAGAHYLRIIVTGYIESGVQRTLSFDQQLIGELHASLVKRYGHYSLWRLGY